MINSTRCAILAKQACATFSQVVQKITPPIANNFLKFFFALFAILTLNAATAWAEEETISFENCVSNGSGTTLTLTWDDNESCTIKQEKSNAQSNVNSTYTNPPRWYAGHIITFTPKNNCTITKIVISTSTNKNGQDITCVTGSGSITKSGNETTITGSWDSDLQLKMGTQCQSPTVVITYEKPSEPPTPAKTYNVTWMVNGEEWATSEDVEENTQITNLPTEPTDNCGNKVFQGWTDKPISGTTNTKPSILFKDKSPEITEGLTTFYAVFATETNSGSGNLTTTFTPNVDDLSTGKNGITIKMSNTAGASGYYQIYKSSSMTIESEDVMTSFILTCTAENQSKYGPGNITFTEGTYSYSSYTGTWTGNATSLTSSNATEQLRIKNIVVTTNSVSTTISDYTTSCSQQPIQLAKPTGLTAKDITSNSATLSWNEVANMTKYEVTITDDHDYTETFTVTDETKSVSSLSPSTTYYWTVKAIGDGTSYTDSEASQHTFTTTAASTPEPGTGDEEGEYVWKLVENVSELHNLDEVIITASGEINYALSTEQKSTNRGATPITKEGNLLKDPSGEVQIITLVETESANVFGFNTGSGHLYAASSSANQLKTKTSLDEHGKWTITISEGVASIVATASTNRNVMQYNPNNSGSPLFACYSSASQTSLAIYKKVTSTDEPDTPTPDEEYISGKWKLVDATSKLQAGMEIIIASVAEESAIKTMAEQRDNNRGAVASSLDGEYLRPAVGTTLITLEDCQLYEDLFALKTKDGYLYAAASGNNHLKSRDGINDNACWEIAIADGVASAKATKSSYRNVLQYNPNNGAPLFSCYASASQKPITIYSKVYDVTATAKNGSVSGTGTYYQGNSVTLKATADFDYEFVNWTVDGEVVSTDNPYKFQVTADVELVAKFQEIAPTTEALSGKFSTGKYEYAEFATGNLQYKPSTDTWRFAKQQYQYVGKDNIYVGKEDYKGWIDLFGWSADDKFGVNSSNDNANYQGEFVDWGKLFPEEGWSTLSKNQWYYLLNQRTNAASLKQIAMVGETLGIMLFPDEWTLPAGCAPTQQTHHDEEDGEDHSCDFVSYNYTLAHWTELEKAGAIFLPAAGRRTGGWGNETISPHMIGKAELDADRHYKHYADYYAYYWTSTKTDGKVNYLINCTLVDKVKDTYTVHAGHVNWAEEARYGQSVRLAKVTNTLIQLGDNDNSEVIEANAGQKVNVQVNRTFKANDGYYTICLPFNIDADEIGTAYQIKEITEHVAGEGINVEFTPADILQAGQPYLLLPSKNLENPIFEGVTIVNTTGDAAPTVSGEGINIAFTGIINGGGETNGTSEYYVGDGGYLYNGKTSKLGLRAFFTITDNNGNPAKVRARVVVGENTATDLDNILNGENTTIKVIKNGQLIIIRNGEKFNAQGQKL